MCRSYPWLLGRSCHSRHNWPQTNSAWRFHHSHYLICHHWICLSRPLNGWTFCSHLSLQLFSEFGPNTTTFIVPGEVFPTRYRSTGHGISAASGKVGAIIAQALSAGVKDRGGKDAWINHLMQIFALFMFFFPLYFSDIYPGCLAFSRRCSSLKQNASLLNR